jgi:hypothetical protein
VTWCQEELLSPGGGARSQRLHGDAVGRALRATGGSRSAQPRRRGTAFAHPSRTLPHSMAGRGNGSGALIRDGDGGAYLDLGFQTPAERHAGGFLFLLGGVALFTRSRVASPLTTLSSTFRGPSGWGVRYYTAVIRRRLKSLGKRPRYTKSSHLRKDVQRRVFRQPNR